MSAELAPSPVRVAFAGSLPGSFAEHVRAQLGMPCEITLTDETAIVPQLAEMDVLITLGFTRAMGAAARRLKLVQVPGAGLDRIDRAALPAGTWLANAYGHETGIAEYVLGAMLASSRGFCRLDASLRRGQWQSPWGPAAPPPAPWPELSGKTLGILGYGRIGRCVAQRAQAFGMTVLALRRASTPDEDAERVVFLAGPGALDELLRRADHLLISLPLTPATRGLLGPRELALMKPTAVLINIARAEIVAEEALYHALAQRTLAAAALDVWYRYPAGAAATLPAEQPFHELPNVLMTPHVSGWTEGTREARAVLMAENIRRVTRGEPPLNQIVSSA